MYLSVPVPGCAYNYLYLYLYLFRRVLNLPAGTAIEYKAHNDSLK